MAGAKNNNDEPAARDDVGGAGKPGREPPVYRYTYVHDAGRPASSGGWAAARPPEVVCPDCGGRGSVTLLTSVRRCRTCGGAGRVDGPAAAAMTGATGATELAGPAGTNPPASASRCRYTYDEHDRIVRVVEFACDPDGSPPADTPGGGGDCPPTG